MIKKVVLLNFLIFIFLASGSLFQVDASDVSVRSMEIEINPDGTNDVRIIQKMIIRGVDDQELTSGLTVSIPYSDYRINGATVNNKTTNFSKGEGRIFVNLKELLLSDGEQATVKIDYTVHNLIYSVWDYKVLKIEQPIDKNYYFELNNNSSRNLIRYINTPSGRIRGQAFSNLLVILGPEKSYSYDYALSYDDINPNTVLPIVSENLGTNYITQIEGSTLGVKDSSDNTFLLSQDHLLVRGYINQNKQITGFPFSNIELDLNISTKEDIYQFFTNKEIVSQTDYTKDYSNFKNKEILNNIESAILASKAFSRLQIQNRVVYGILNHPDNYQIAHFWLEYNDQGIKKTFDPYFNKSIGADNTQTYPIRFALGVLNDDNLNDLNNISYFEKLQLDNLQYKYQETKSVLGESSSYIDLIHSQADTLLVVHNNSDNFLSILGASSEIIDNEVENIVILPRSKQNFPLFSSNVEEVEFSFEMNGNEFNKKFSISNNTDFRNFYAQIAIGLFASISIILILGRFSYRTLKQTRILQKIKNKTVNRIDNIND